MEQLPNFKLTKAAQIDNNDNHFQLTAGNMISFKVVAARNNQ